MKSVKLTALFSRSSLLACSSPHFVRPISDFSSPSFLCIEALYFPLWRRSSTFISHAIKMPEPKLPLLMQPLLSRKSCTLRLRIFFMLVGHLILDDSPREEVTSKSHALPGH